MFEIRKRVQFPEDPKRLASLVGDLARDVLRAGRESVALDGTNGPLTGVLDAGLQAIDSVLTLTFGSAPAEARILDRIPTLEVDWSAGQYATALLTKSATAVQFSDPPGIGRLVLYVEQGTASNTLGGWDSRIIWAGGTAPVITAAVDSRDKLTFEWDGENYWGHYRQDYS